MNADTTSCEDASLAFTRDYDLKNLCEKKNERLHAKCLKSTEGALVKEN